MHNQAFSNTILGIILLGAVGSVLGVMALGLYKRFIHPYIKDVWGTAATAIAERSRSQATKRLEKLTRQLAQTDHYRKHPSKFLAFAVERLFGILLMLSLGAAYFLTLAFANAIYPLTKIVTVMAAYSCVLVAFDTLLVVGRMARYDSYKGQVVKQIERLEQAAKPRSAPPSTSEGLPP